MPFRAVDSRGQGHNLSILGHLRAQERELSTRSTIQKLPKTLGNAEDGKQVILASGFVGTNFAQANEALSKQALIKP